MRIPVYLRNPLLRCLQTTIILSIFALVTSASHAASVRGVVTDSTGATVSGATVGLIANGSVVASSVSTADGSFQITTSANGRFFLVVTANNFRQLQTPDFYAGQFDSLERNVVLEPAWVRQSIVVTATGTPVPQSQTAAATTVLSPLDLAQRDDLVSVLRLMPGTFVAQSGQRGAVTSLFVRGGDSDDNKILVDGIDAGDLGNQFDFGQLTTTAVESAEVNRGPNSNLFGAGAMTSVVNLTTPHGTTSFPSLLLRADAGNLFTSREGAEVAGSRQKLDYLGDFNWLQTNNSLPNDQYHVASTAGNIGWAPNGTTQLRGTAHYFVNSSGEPNAWDFYHVADNATQKDQNLFISASLVNQTTPSFQNSLHYGATRKREQYSLWNPSGNFQAFSNYCFDSAYLGNVVTITGANGYSATGQAVLDCNGIYPRHSQTVNNRDQVLYQGDYQFTPHFVGLIGFRYEDERGSEPGSTYYTPVERRNYDYIASVHGDLRHRLYYTLGGSLQHYSLFGTQTSPRAGLSYYAFKPRNGAFSGTRIMLNFGDAVREPKLADQDDSLYSFLAKNGGQSTIQQLHIDQITAPQERTYEGGIEQSFWDEHIVFRASYFHNQFGREIEYVGLDLIPQLLPTLSATQQQQLESLLQANFAYELTINSEAFRAQGIESTIESGIGKNIFLRGGYTWLDAVVQRSFTNSDQMLLGPLPTFTNGLPIGPYAPLQGARPFRRPPHTGFVSATYAGKKITGVFTSSFASKSDDSTYLEGEDANGGNSLLLPNRNLDYGYAKLDLGGSYQIFDWLEANALAENLLDNQHIAPIGYQSLPFTVRAGFRLSWGAGKH